MEHNRPVLPVDHEILVVMQEHVGQIVLTPVFLNGESRQAFAIVLENSSGIFLRILGVALNPGDITQDSRGEPASATPPSGKEAIN